MRPEHWLFTIPLRLRSLFRGAQADQELDDELRDHLERRTEEYVAKGMAPEEARRRARLDLGGIEQTKEKCRDARRVNWIQDFVQDLRYGVRTLRKSPGFATAAVLTLALGIGANTAIFCVVNGVLLRPLPYRDSPSLVNIWGKLEKQGIPFLPFSEPEYWDLLDHNESFSQIAAYYVGGDANLTRADAPPVHVTEATVTASLFPLLGVTPVLGRSFAPDEDQPGHSNFAVLSYAAWRGQFGGDPNIVNQSIRLDGEVYSVLGVLPRQFSLGGKQDLWVPLALNRAKPQDRGSHYLNVVARSKLGWTTAGVSNALERFAQYLRSAYPSNYGRGDEKKFDLRMVPVKEQLTNGVRPALLVLLGAVAFVLLIACANVANLQLAQASSREKELAVRTALGAGRSRLIRQLLTESLILAFAGGLLGLLLAYWGVAAFRALAPPSTPRLDEVQLNWVVLAFTFGVSLLTGLFFGIAPAWHVPRTGLRETLNESGRGASTSAATRRLRAVLVVSELAIAVVLLTGAGLLIRSFNRLLAVSPGFQSQQLLTVNLSLPEKTYADGAPVQNFFRELMARVNSVPGVQSAGAVSQMPFTDNHNSGSVFFEDTPLTDLPRYPDMQNLPLMEIDTIAATPGYFEALQIPILSGRLINKGDDASAPLVAVVDENFAHRFWPHGDAVGHRVAVDAVPKVKPLMPRWRTIVGVVAHVKHFGLDLEGREQIYTPHAQPLYGVYSPRTMTLAVRTSLDPASVTSAIRQQVFAADKDLPLYNIATMDQLVSASVAQPRLNLSLLVAFAGLALALAAVGVYGVMAYGVTQRTHEFGIRMAIGAQPSSVVKQVFLEGGRLTCLGLAFGLFAALLLTRLMASLLFAVKPIDPATLGAAAGLLAFVALAACYIPARRATRVHPLVALRYE
jgi:putative ABC transport system permease protein